MYKQEMIKNTSKRWINFGWTGCKCENTAFKGFYLTKRCLKMLHLQRKCIVAKQIL